MRHTFTFADINTAFFSEHLMELIIMLTGTIAISFLAGRFFGKTPFKEREVKTEINIDKAASKGNNTFFNEGEMNDIKVQHQTIFEEKEKNWQQQLEQLQLQVQQGDTAANLLKDEKEALGLQVNLLNDYLNHQSTDLLTMGQLRESITGLESNIAALQLENKQLQTTVNGFQSQTNHNANVSETTLQNSYKAVDENLVKENETLAYQLQQINEEKDKLANTVITLQKQIYVLQAQGSTTAGNKAANNSLMVLMEEKVQVLQKERNDLMTQILQLENKMKITNLTSFNKVDMDQEEENPVKRLVLYIRMVEGEKQGLNNKIDDLTKKLNQALLSVDQVQTKEVELSYVKSRLDALDKDKRDVQSQAREWEVMYKKLQEKMHYMLSSKETELEQLKTTTNYLEKDKSRLQGRINNLESELRSNVFNYKGRNPLALNL
jgi:chromosome segregation ATPase